MPKGPESERETSKEISLWWSYNVRSDLVWRTAGSGARSTVRAKKKKKTAYQAGDLTFIDPVIKPLFDLLLIENKAGYTVKHKLVRSKKTGKQSVRKKSGIVDVLDFVDSVTDTPLLMQWWEKAQKEREHSGRKFAVIIFKRDRHEKCIMMSVELFVYLEEINGVYINPMVAVTPNIGQTLVIISFEVFKHWCPPASIYKLCKRSGIECIIPETKKPKLIRRP